MRTREDPERIHNLRVASRRLRIGLLLFGDCLPERLLDNSRRRVRRLTRVFGAARDADVQILHLDETWPCPSPASRARHRRNPQPDLRPGIARLRLRLVQRRRSLDAAIAAELNRFERNEVLPQLSSHLRRFLQAAGDRRCVTLSAAFRVAIREEIDARARELLAFESFVASPECVDELHRMRIVAKHLRYALESFRPFFADAFKDHLRALVRLQTLLGDLHDADVWIEWLPRFLEEERRRVIEFQGHARGFGRLEPGLRAVAAERCRFRDRRYRQFREHWNALHRKHILTGLQEGVHLRPVNEEVAV